MGVKDTGSGARKLLTCQNCGNSFTAPLRRGRYPTYCNRSSCQRVRRLKANSAFEVLSEEQREKRCEQQRIRDERRRELQQEADTEVLRQRILELEGTNASLLKELDQKPDREPLDPSSEAILKLAENLNGVSRSDLTASVRRLAYAEGVDDTYAQLVEVASIATAWARRIQLPFNQRDPAYDRVPDFIEQAEYEELMAA